MPSASTTISPQNSYYGSYILNLSWSESSPNIEANTSKITATATLSSNTAAFSSTTCTMTLKWYDGTHGWVNMGSYSFTQAGDYYYGFGSPKIEKSIDITHNSDGNLSGYVQVDLNCNSNAYAPNSKSLATGSQALSTIPRATDVNLSTTRQYMGSSVTISGSPHSRGFSHEIYYQLGGADKVSIASLGTGNFSQSWTIPTSLANSVTNSTFADISIVVDTISNGSVIGTKSKALTILVPDSYKPSVSVSNISEANSTVADKFGSNYYVQSKTQLKFTISASGTYSSSIVSTSLKIDGQGYTFSDSTATTNTINSSGDVAYEIVTTDSRGRSFSHTGIVSIHAYTAPTFYAASAKRANSSYGADESNGVYALLLFNYAITPLDSKNNASFVIQYRKKNGSWSGVNSWSSYRQNTTYHAGNLFSDTASEYEVRFGLKDYFLSDYIWFSVIVPTTYTLINFGSSGKSVALFAQSNDEENTLEINGTIKLLVNNFMQSINSIVTRFLKIEEWKQTIASWKQTIASWKANVEEGNTTITLNRYSNYSEKEIDTHTTWIDGKTIYKKTVRTGLISSGTKQKAHGIKNLVTVVKMEGIAVNGSPEFVVLPRGHKDNENDGISLQLRGDYIKVVAGAFNEFDDSYVTVYYTKE